MCAAERKRPGTCARLPSLDRRRPDVTSALCLSSFFTPSTHTLALVALPRHGQGVPQVTQPTGASGDVLVLVSGAPRWAGPAHTHTLTKRRSVLPDSISDNSGNSSSEESNGERQHRALASAQETGASSSESRSLRTRELWGTCMLPRDRKDVCIMDAPLLLRRFAGGGAREGGAEGFTPLPNSRGWQGTVPISILASVCWCGVVAASVSTADKRQRRGCSAR